MTIDIIIPKFIALFYENIKLKYRVPKGIVSNRNTRITSKFWAKVYTYSLIKQYISIVFYSQIDS